MDVSAALPIRVSTLPTSAPSNSFPNVPSPSLPWPFLKQRIFHEILKATLFSVLAMHPMFQKHAASAMVGSGRPQS